MLNALIIDFFDSIGVYIAIIPSSEIYGLWFFGVFKIDFEDVGFISLKDTSRTEATIEAIKKANEIHNAN